MPNAENKTIFAGKNMKGYGNCVTEILEFDMKAL
jgi:hypothetical protein